MVINCTKISKSNIDDHCCLEVIVRFAKLGGIDDHCCFEVIAYFVDLCGID
jgi:hypothetical protein